MSDLYAFKANLTEEIVRLKQQLTAEREKHEGMAHHMEACRALLNVPDDDVLYDAIEQLQEQLSAVTVALTKADTELAAEREARKQAEDDFILAGRNNEQLRQQLAAERENRERLENALTFADKTNSGLHRVITGHDNQIEQLRNQLDAEREALERERMCHAACGVIALSNTRKSLGKNRMMKPEYLSASVQDCIKAAEREIELREQLAAERQKVAAYEMVAVQNRTLHSRLAAAVEALKELRAWLAEKGENNALVLIDAALARIGGK